MRKSKDTAIVVFLSVLGFVYSLTVGQLLFMFTGIPGLNSLFGIGYAVFISLGMLMYEGRRWRFLLQGILVAILYLPTYTSGIPFDILSRMPIVVSALFADILFNSIYGYFDKNNNIRNWVMLSTLGCNLINILSTVLIWSLYYSPEFINTYLNVTLILMPVIVIEYIFGSLIGYKIYQRVKKVW